jgi:hypothetical protein
LVTEQIFRSIENEWSGDRARLYIGYVSLDRYLGDNQNVLSKRDKVRISNRMGDILLLIGDPDKAFGCYDNACKNGHDFPEMSLTYRGLASIARHHDDYPHAKNLIGVAKSYCGERGRCQASLNLEEGLIERLDGGSIEKAIELHKKGLRLVVSKLSNGPDIIAKRLYGQLNLALCEEFLIAGVNGFRKDFEHNLYEASRVAKELGCKPDIDRAYELLNNL